MITLVNKCVWQFFKKNSVALFSCNQMGEETVRMRRSQWYQIDVYPSGNGSKRKGS